MSPARAVSWLWGPAEGRGQLWGSCLVSEPGSEFKPGLSVTHPAPRLALHQAPPHQAPSSPRRRPVHRWVHRWGMGLGARLILATEAPPEDDKQMTVRRGPAGRAGRALPCPCAGKTLTLQWVLGESETVPGSHMGTDISGSSECGLPGGSVSYQHPSSPVSNRACAARCVSTDATVRGPPGSNGPPLRTAWATAVETLCFPVAPGAGLRYLCMQTHAHAHASDTSACGCLHCPRLLPVLVLRGLQQLPILCVA